MDTHVYLGTNEVDGVRGWRRGGVSPKGGTVQGKVHFQRKLKYLFTIGSACNGS